MVKHRTTTTIDRALGAMRSMPAYDAAWEDRLMTRVRRDVHARFGSFVVRTDTQDGHAPEGDRAAVHTMPFALRGMLELMRPAAALAIVVVSVIGFAVFTMSQSSTTGTLADGVQTSSMMYVASPDISPGSGSNLSVFGGTVASIPVDPIVVQTRSFTRPARINPASGVFSQWGTGVFSDQEVMHSRAGELNVYDTDGRG
jgi:hypothetical protein